MMNYITFRTSQKSSYRQHRVLLNEDRRLIFAVIGSAINVVWNVQKTTIIAQCLRFNRFICKYLIIILIKHRVGEFIQKFNTLYIRGQDFI